MGETVASGSCLPLLLLPQELKPQPVPQPCLLISFMHLPLATGPVRVPLWVRPGSLVFPETPDTPIIMVGPGTGVAPFRAAIQERVAHGQTGEYRSPRAV